jgi:hypothetical protein
MKEIIQSHISNNMTWNNIKALLRVDSKLLSSILMGDQSLTECLPLTMRVSYHDIHYAISSHFKSISRKDDDFAVSIQLWGEHIVKERGYFYSKNLFEYERGMFCFAFMSEWQLKVWL